MLQEPRIKEIALDTARTNFAPLRVLDALVEPTTGWLGDELWQVMLIIPASAVRKLRGEVMTKFMIDLDERLEAEGETRSTRIRYATPADLAADADPES